MSDEVKILMDSKDPQDRKRAIKILAQWADSSALPYLNAIYKTDNDPEVRELAIKAGKYIKHNLSQPATQRTVVPKEPQPVEEEEARPPSDEDRAKQLMDRAKDEFDDRHEKVAVELAKNAFALYPALKNDEYYLGLLAQFIGVEPDQAVAALVEYITGKRKITKNKRYLHETTLGEMLLDLFIIFLVVVGGMIVLNVGISLAIKGDVDHLNEVIGGNSLKVAVVQTELKTLTTLVSISPDDIGSAMGKGIQSGLQTVISLVIGYFIINFVANSLAGGDGTFNGLVHVTTVFQIVTTLVTYLFTFILCIVLAKAIFNGFIDSYTTKDNSLLQTTIANANGTLTIIGGGLAVFGFVSLLWFTRLVSRNYNLGFFEGCGTIVAAVFVAAGAWCGILFALTALLSTSTG